jgi:type I thyroxine 5'-deiodinase
MERLYQTYRDLAEFRLVYIREAHAADSKWSVDYAHEKKIFEHTTFAERCSSAKALIDDKSLTIPCIVDDMENTANLAYSGWPDRIFVVRTDGTLAVAADEGPFGFVPALEETEAWLQRFRVDGSEEPRVAEDAAGE